MILIATPANRFLIAPLLVFCTGCQPHSQISFSDHVYPILESNCFYCHSPPNGEGYRNIGLSLVDYKSLMAGTMYGPVIVPGDSKKSILNMLIEGRADKSMQMPHNEEYSLNEYEIRTLRIWVEQGARNN